MAKYTLRRLVKFFSTIWLIAAVTFFPIHMWIVDGLYADWASREAFQRYIRAYDLNQPLVQRFFSYLLLDVEEGQRAEISRLDFGVFGVYQIGLENGATLACGAVCLNFGPSYRQRGKPVEDILFGPLP